MARNFLVKALYGESNLASKFRPNICSCRQLFSFKQKDETAAPKDVMVRQEDQVFDPPSFKINWKRLKRSWMYYMQYSNAYKDNTIHDDENNLRLRMIKQDEIIYHMRNKDDLEHWFVMTDEDIGGHSWAEIKQSSNDMTMLFRGYLNQKPPNDFYNVKLSNNAERTFTGSALVETKPFYAMYDGKENFSTELFNCYEIRIRGDGRRYWFETTCEYLPTERLVYRYPIYTRGGPLWEKIYVPFTKMHSRGDEDGKMILKQRPFMPTMISNFRFLLNDGIEGPFQLEIDYIAMTNNMKFGSIDDGTSDVYDPWEPINVNSGA